MLKRRIVEMFDADVDYWQRLTSFADKIEGLEDHTENSDFRATVIPAQAEQQALHANPTAARNWSRYLRAPHSYFEIFGLT